MNKFGDPANEHGSFRPLPPTWPKPPVFRQQQETKKPTCRFCPQAIRHVGLLINEPPGVGILCLSRAALYLVVRLIKPLVNVAMPCTRLHQLSPSYHKSRAEQGQRPPEQHAFMNSLDRRYASPLEALHRSRRQTCPLDSRRSSDCPRWRSSTRACHRLRSPAPKQRVALGAK